MKFPKKQQAAYEPPPTGSVDLDGIDRYRHRAYREHPLLWIDRFLGKETWLRQAEILNALAKQRYDADGQPVTSKVAVASGHKLGKSYGAAMFALFYLFTRPKSAVILTGPRERTVYRTLMKYVKQMIRETPDPRLLNCDLMEREVRMRTADRTSIVPGWGIWGFVSKDTGGAQGYHAKNICFIVDEAVDVPREVIEVLETMCQSPSARLLLLANPTSNLGYFAERFRGAGDWQTFQISCLESPNITGEEVAPSLRGALATQEYVDAQINEHGAKSNWVQSRVYGEFPTESADVLFPSSLIEKVMQREPNPNAELMRAIGVDVARTGNDETVVAGCYGDRIVLLLRERVTENYIDLAARIYNIMDEDRVEVVWVDATGWGAGLYDALRASERRRERVVKGVEFGSKPDREKDQKQFTNMRSSIYWKGREFLKERGLFCPDNDRTFQRRLIEELQNTRYTYAGSGGNKIQIASKDDINREIKRSPDTADAVMLAINARQRYESDKTAFDQYGQAYFNVYGVDLDADDRSKKRRRRLSETPVHFW